MSFDPFAAILVSHLVSAPPLYGIHDFSNLIQRNGTKRGLMFFHQRDNRCGPKLPHRSFFLWFQKFHIIFATTAHPRYALRDKKRFLGRLNNLLGNIQPFGGGETL